MALQQEGSDGALCSLALFSRKLSGSKLNCSPRDKECYAIVAALVNRHRWVGNKQVVVRTDQYSPEHWPTEDLKTMGHVGMICSLKLTSMWFTPLGL